MINEMRNQMIVVQNDDSDEDEYEEAHNVLFSPFQIIYKSDSEDEY
jgi:hypothetical protein